MVRNMRNKLVQALVVSSCLVAGCGGGGGGSAQLNTSYVTAVAKTSVLDADVVSWVDAAGAKTAACTETSYPSIPVADSVDVEVASKAYSNTGVITLPIRIESATISYTPANSATPPMASEFQTFGVILNNGSSVTVPIRVVSQEQKIRLQPKLACSAPIYNYYTTITLNLSEIGGKSSTTETSLQLRLADFIDK